jgi:hypothetical protein
MSASTAERTDAHQLNPPQHTGFTDLVRTIGGDQAPAAGAWEIGSGQRLDLAARGLRTRALPARVCAGTLFVADDLVGSSLEFIVHVPDMDFSAAFSTRVSRLIAVDSWQADGTTATAGGSRPVSLRLRNNGVFRQRGRPPSLWLGIQGAADLPELSIAVGSRRAGRLRIAAELNLNPGVATDR